jgi:glutaredoxin
MITIYSKNGCPFCVKAIDYARDLVGDGGVTIINNPDKALVEELKATHNHHTYPYVFVGKTFIGGYTNLTEDYVKVISLLKDQFNFDVEF